MQNKIQSLIQQASEVVLDKNEVIRLAVICLFAEGHLLIEDVPGVGKTTLVQTLGHLLGLKTQRIQCTIDLMPSDILGGNIFNQKTLEFQFFPGPIFSELLLTDELNRTGPRTQSALLQAMEESQISVDGKTWDLPKPFFVVATQNPTTNVGTFQLPESQIDRFLMCLEMNYASYDTEVRILQKPNTREKLSTLKPVFEKNEILKIQKSIHSVSIPEVVASYVANILKNSRKIEKTTANIITPAVTRPLSTRAGVALVKAAQVVAFLDQRNYVRPDDIKEIAEPVLGHRLAAGHGVRKGYDLVKELLSTTEIPR